jgi:serine/threonine protein kinase
VPGAVVARRFRAERRIASGSMGEVWAGDHVRLKLKVAMKILRREAQANHEIVTRFSREAFLLGQIQTDRVARVYDFVSRGRYAPVLVMELVDGPSLAQVLSTKQLPVEDAIRLGLDLAKALRDLHAAKVVHRDLKPANVMLRPRPEGEFRTVFVDLGVSRLLSDEAADDGDQLTEITTADRCVGTMEYMAPEQILSSRSAKPSVDVYAVGAILFRAVAGHNVFGDLGGLELARKKLSESPPALSTGRSDLVARGFEEVLARALSPSPDDRFEGAEELLTELSYLRDAASRASCIRSAVRFQLSAAARAAPPAATAKKARRILLPRSMPLYCSVAAVVILGIGTVLGAFAARRRSPGSGPRIDADQCRVVGRSIESTPLRGARSVVLSISCPEPDPPLANGEAPAH